MAKLGKAIDLRPFEGIRVRQRVTTIGLELEGGWLKLPEGVNLTRDASVVIRIPVPALENEEYRLLRLKYDSNPSAMTAREQRRFQDLYRAQEIGHIPLQTGEIPSPVLSTSKEKGDLYWENWLRRFFPSHVNETCGLHVHMGFATHFTYQRLMVPEFPATILSGMNLWAEREKLPSTHQIWPRLAGKSEYCQHTFYAQEQSQDVNKDYDHHRVGNRYSVVAYRWARHQSIEVRLLPAFEDPSQAVRAIEEIIKITNLFLLATKKREEKKKIEVPVDTPADVRWSFLEV